VVRSADRQAGRQAAFGPRSPPVRMCPTEYPGGGSADAPRATDPAHRASRHVPRYRRASRSRGFRDGDLRYRAARDRRLCASCGPADGYSSAVQDPPGERTGIWAYAPTSGQWKHFSDADPKLWDDSEPVVKLMPEYSVDIPLWGPWPELDLSETLLAQVRSWQESFDESFRWNSGWMSSAARDRWAQEAEVIEAELRQEVGDRVDVVVDLWADAGRLRQRVSRRGESHPPPLSGPDVTVSCHPAPTVRPSVNATSCQWAKRVGLRR
jgi:hypothetical protein